MVPLFLFSEGLILLLALAGQATVPGVAESITPFWLAYFGMILAT